MPSSFFGKYRATVLDNLDPTGCMRLNVAVPDVPIASAWAEACLPMESEFAVAPILPAPGASVWVEFEGGDPGLPIWSGRMVGPAGDAVDPAMLLVVAQNGGIELQFRGGGRIRVEPAAMSLLNDKGASVVLTGPTVSINNDGLTVT